MVRRQYILSLAVVLVPIITIACSLFFTDNSYSKPTGYAPWYMLPDSTNPSGAAGDTTKKTTDTQNGSTTGGNGGDKVDLPYPIHDREGDHVTDNHDNNPFELKDPGDIVKKAEYDPETDRYVITEQVDGHDIKPPTYLTFEEYLQYQKQESERAYYRERANSISLVEKKGLIPKLVPKKKAFGELFGPGGVEIRPSGNVDITFGGNWQKIDNPILTEAARKQGGFNFDMHINMNVVGTIGDKLKINLSYNTGATFDFENQIKLKYEGKDDDIIKSIEAGNVSFPLKTSLIQGPSSLFGVKTKLQFGRLTITNVFSQQKSKAQNLTIQNGSQIQTYEVFSDQYEENRNFFLAQKFRDNYDHALANLPNINSLVNITRLEVWVTNKTGATQDVRDVVALMDLGEHDSIYRNGNPILPGTITAADNAANSLYSLVSTNPGNRDINNIVSFLNSNGLVQSEDYEKTLARKLSSTEYTYNPQLGYISLNTVLGPDDVLGVAYEYTENGVVHKVGEFAQDVVPDSNSAGKVLFLKMLKATSVRPTLPIWQLMMKNVYSLGAFQVNSEDFKLEIYYQDPGGGLKRYIPEGSMNGKLLVRQLNLDNLNSQLDPQPDGVFDFIPGITINPANGRIIFPVLEPFGKDLKKKFTPTEQNNGIADKYVYTYLYDSTKVVAQQHPEKNRFVIKGSYKSSVSSDISLGAFNIPQGSVKVTAGGTQLVEGKDYTVDYSLGRIKILNEGVLNAGTPVNVSFENNALFGFQTKTLFGTRLDYAVSDKFNIGFTHMHLKERPFTQKVNIGDDPISNTIWGLDLNYNTESEFITWLLDKLPFYSTKEKSSVTISAEMARLKPGHSSAIGKSGQVYIDDFEGASSNYDLRYPATSWHLASTPKDASRGGPVLFPEADRIKDLAYSYNRALLAWYNIDPLFLRGSSAAPSYINDDKEQLSDPYVREVPEQQIFPNKTLNNNSINSAILTFDMAYYPSERGPYNYEHTANGLAGVSSGLNPDGSLKRPETRWGGVMRALDNTDFEASNVEFIEFWVLDPFIKNPNSRGGELYINLGNVCEDVERDSRLFFENGLPVPNSTVPVDQSVWGNIPRTQPIVNAFDNDPNNRAIQDVGLDGLTDAEENSFFDTILQNVSGVLDPAGLAAYQADPSNDDYHYFLGDDLDQQRASILQRYKHYNGQEGNSPVQTGNSLSTAATNIPDAEDLNKDNSLNESENYFQYRIKLDPNDNEIGRNFISDKIVATVDGLPNGTTDQVTWYQYKIPITSYDKVVGGIQDFRSIRFIRMFLTNFQDPVILRFARLELVRNQWRRYAQSLLEPGEYVPNDQTNNTIFDVGSVNVEENSNRTPIPYILPPGIYREQDLSSGTNVNALLNEQSLDVKICALADGDARAIYKNLNLDFRTYKRLQMFVHGESYPNSTAPPIKDNDLNVFVRIGSDFTQNYYEYEWPLKVTPPTVAPNDTLGIWPEANNLDIPLDSLVAVKLERDKDVATSAYNTPFSIRDTKGNTYTIVGNPDLGVVKTVMIGVRNPKATGSESDDGQPKCVEVWLDELRLNGFDEKGGWAAVARLETQLADLGNFTFSANMHTQGYGQIEQKVQERYKDNLWAYDLATNLELGKFFPNKWGLHLPLYVGFSQSFSTPEYDPYELDVPLSEKLATLSGSEKRDYRRKAQNYIKITSVNFTNVRLVSQKKDKKPHFWDPSNLNLTYAYSEVYKTDPLTEHDLLQKHKANLSYNFAPKERPLYPFKKMLKNSSKWLDIIRDINFNPIPNSLSFSTDFNRQFGEVQVRAIGDELPIDPTYNKYFTWDRMYGLKYNPAKSIALDFSAVNNARIDEPYGRLDTKAKKDTLYNNLLHFGRTTRYQQSFSASYNLPLEKIPLLDWVDVKTNYNSTFSWTAGALVFDDVIGKSVDNPLGNTIANSNAIRFNGELNFKTIYDKFGFLKPYNSSTSRNEDKATRQKKKDANDKKRTSIKTDIAKQKDDLAKAKVDLKKLKAGDDENKADKIKQLKTKIKQIKAKIKKLKQDRKKILDPEEPTVSPFIRPVIMLKRVSANYTENYTTTLPGYVPHTRFFGQDKGFNTPGLGFVFGVQPSQKKLDEFADKGWITTDPDLNYQFIQTQSKNLSIKGTLEPFKDFRVDLTFTKTESQNYTEYFKRQFDTSTVFSHLTPQTTGSYSISFVAVRTMFSKVSSSGVSNEFRKFEEYRSELSNRLGEQNPNAANSGYYVTPKDENGNSRVLTNYRYGYGPYSQDVLIPAFIAAYTGKSPDKVKLNPFKMIPLPNWRVTYNGLSKFKFLQKVITNVVISHAYNSTFTMSSFQSNLGFLGDGYLKPAATDTSLNNFISQYNIPQITITEQFSPLIGVDITWKNGITTKFDYKKTRNLSMSFVGYRLTESRTTEMTFGFGYLLKGLKFGNLKFRGKPLKLQNDINFACDVSYRDNISLSEKLDQDITEPTSGAKTIIVSPYVTYVISKRLRVKLFFERTRTIPATSASFPITNTKAGITLSFNLTP